MKKRFTAFLLVLSVALCGGQNAPSSPQSAGGKEQESLSSPAQDASSPQDILSPQEAVSPDRTVIVSSREAVQVVPDMAEIVYSVSTEAPDAAACQQQNDAEVEQVASLLKELGVEEKSIRTTDYYMGPRYNWSNDTRVLIGYEVTATLTVSDIPMEQAGTILSESVKAGINNIQSISYLSSGYDGAYQEALAMAVQTAAEKAQAMAEAAGYTLGDILRMQETSSYSQARYQDDALVSRKQMAAAEESSAILPGELAVEAEITVEYGLLPAGR